jgi:DNA-binding GntR family transcriptional regulator
MTATPTHVRIRNDLLQEIESGAFTVDKRLPGEVELAERYGVTRMTVRQALATLVNDGMLVRRRGVGTFIVQGAAKRRNMSRLTGFMEDMRNDGRDVRTRIFTQQIEPPSAELASSLQLTRGVHVIHVARLRSVDGEPVVVQHSWVPYDRAPGLWNEPLVDDSLYATLRERYGIRLRRADQRIGAEAASGEPAELLELPVGAPLLRVERLTFDAGNVPVEFARSWTRPGFEIAMHIEQ